MEPVTSATVYRVKLAPGACRSALALLALRAEGLDGVRAANITGEDSLVLVAREGADLFEDILTMIVRAGLDPLTTNVTAFEREAPRPKEPVRATPVQRVAVHVNGGYDPDTILVSARVPTEISFSEGHDCLARVVFDSLGLEADLERGGALVSLPALEPGTYRFRCGRDVVHGTLIAE